MSIANTVLFVSFVFLQCTPVLPFGVTRKKPTRTCTMVRTVFCSGFYFRSTM